MPEISVSVVVPVLARNEADVQFLQWAIASIQNQTLRPKEIILVDDGSTITFIDKIDTKDVVYVRSDMNEGIGKARNAGVGLAKGTHVAFCSSDDLWDANKLKLQAELATKHPEEILYSDYLNIDEQNRIISQFKAPWHDDPQQMILELWSWASRGDLPINFSSILVPKKCFEKVPMGTRRESEDLEFILKVCKYFNFRHIPKPLISYRRHPQMRTANRTQNELMETARNIVNECKEWWQTSE